MLRNEIKYCKQRCREGNFTSLHSFNRINNRIISSEQTHSNSVTRMHVYLKDGHQRRWVTDVHLQEGFFPCIGNGLTRKTCADVSRLEPAIWFKVLVLESVSVDCGRRIVSWSTGSHSEVSADADSPNQRACYMEGECYDYDADIDELFHLAAKVICPDGHEENGISQPSDEDHEQCLLRMLHCYILPKITLHQNDLDKVITAREKQVQSIQELDRKVIEECKTIDACEQHLEDLRTQFLPDLENFIERGWCSKVFLDLLLEDISKEEPRLRQQIDKAQDQVQHAKHMSAQKPSPASTEQLKAARQQRDREQEKLEALLMTRELIFSASRQAKNNGPVVAEHHLLKQYTDERETLAGLKQNRNRILEQKNCALSVREMLDSAMKELVEKGYTDANDANALGSRATDVLAGVWKPEWQKLGERIATLVNNEEHPIGNHFQTFCLRIHTLCKELISTGTFSSSEDFTPSCSPFGRSCPTQYEAYGLEDFVMENHRHKLQMLQSEIFKQLNTATEFLSEFFNNKDVHFKNKMRLCYEQCFYDKEHSFLACVYELAHHDHVDKLEQDVRRLRCLPIKLLNLPMKDEWWLELFEQRSLQISMNSEHHRPFTQAYRNGTLLDQTGYGLSGSYDMIHDLDEFVSDDSTDALNGRHIEDIESFRSLCISAIRQRSKTVTVKGVELPPDQPDAGHPKSKLAVETALSCSAPTMVQIIGLWETTQVEASVDSSVSGPLNPPLKRMLSKSESELSRKDSAVAGETFEDHFGPALQNIRDIFKVASPLNKLKCLTSSLRKITNAVQELRMQSGQDKFTAAVNAEDLLPLLVLMMLQMEPWEVASMWPQLAFTEDLMAPFLSSGCHGWALVEFQMAQRILNELCNEF